MERPSTSPLVPSSNRADTSLLPMVLRDLSGAISVKNDRVGHYLAMWALSCPLARRQFRNAIQHVNTATCTKTARDACKAVGEAYTASLLHPTAMCELVLNLRGPKSSWRSLSELYTLRKLKSHRNIAGGAYTPPISTERNFQARWEELVRPIELDDPVATLLPQATGISWPFASLVKYILSRPGLVRSINRSFRLTFIVRGMSTPWPLRVVHG